METITGSLVALIAFNPSNLGIYLPMLGIALIGFLYLE